MANGGSRILSSLVSEHGKKAKLAEEVGGGCDVAMVGRWASGERRPGPRYRKRLEELLGISWTAWDEDTADPGDPPEQSDSQASA